MTAETQPGEIGAIVRARASCETCAMNIRRYCTAHDEVLYPIDAVREGWCLLWYPARRVVIGQHGWETTRD